MAQPLMFMMMMMMKNTRAGVFFMYFNFH
jgi:hypothetical protein